MDLESRRRIEEEIMESLKNSSISTIAICGVGGVGKTTMAERIGKRVMDENLFDEIVMVVVGQQVDMIKIQEEIAQLLGLTLNVERMSARAHQLRKRLMDANRKIIIFDDVQRRLELEDLGVPAESEFEMCKILLTTRLKQTCEEMKAHKVIAMEVLNKEEAWSLFKNKAGNVVEDPVLRSVAEEIAAECKGLPIALVTVGKALKTRTMSVLRDSLLQEFPAPPASMASTSQTLTMDFESRKQIEEQIMESLRNSSISTIAICGMGGVGKTTMAQRIGKRVMDENLFDEIVMVAVGQQVDMIKIQEEIAEWLKLKFNVKYMSTRAAKLRERLMDKKRKIIILDNVWENVRFEELGIPIESNFERCKVLLTCGSADASKGIKNEMVFKLEILEKDEAWLLFKDKAGDCVEDLQPVANAIVTECDGLPLALVTVGLALQNETNKHTWKYCLSKLKQAKPTYLPKEIMTHVYQSLELSYEKLDTDLEKMFFLLCCLFPEYYDIPIQQLTWYSMGLRLFDDISIEEATNKTHSLVGKLKSRFLLIDGRDKCHVKMHDVVREVAIYIGSKERNGFLKSMHRTSIENSKDVNCNWLSVDISNGRMEVPVLSRFPKLSLFMLSSNEFYDISHISFERIEDLNVLSFRRVSIGSLPPKLGSLKNLQTLRLFDCEVENISVIGELTSLKILGCYECQNIWELPAAIGRLKGLRLLELSGCRKLQRIPFGIISNLRRLEELKMLRSFSGWEAEENGKERRNASLRELECLPNLSCLEIEIDDCTLSAQEICLSQNLVKYYIGIGRPRKYWNNLRDYDKVMELNLPSHIGAVGEWIQMQVRSTEWLYLEGDGSGSNNFNIAESESLRNLRVYRCSTLNKQVETKYCKFHNLKSIEITSCPKLRSLFSLLTARRYLLQLEVLCIERCELMEQVFWNEGTDDNTDGCIEFPKLKELRLRNLPNFTAFCQGLENMIIKFPNLTEMKIEGLPKLNSLSHLNSETIVWHDQNTCFHLFCNWKVEMGSLKTLSLTGCLKDNIRNIWCRQIPPNFFNKLQELRIYHMHGIESLLSYPMAKNLVSLISLYIEDCNVMVEVIKSNAVEAVDRMPLLFPTLKVLSITKLLELRSFWPVNHPLELPLLEYVDIQQCPVMKTFTYGSLKAPKIRMIDINNHQINDQKDLNRVTSDFRQNSSTKSINECVREIGNCIPIQGVWSFLESHFNYWWCFDSNIQELRRRIENLGCQTYDGRPRIGFGRLTYETPRHGVLEWLEAIIEELAEVRRISEPHIPNKWNLISRYSVGKGAKQAAEKIAMHQNDGNFIRISDPKHPACMASTSQRQTMDFESRKQIEEEIMESLRNSSISTIAICGMGGVGKSVMAQRIRNRVMEENLFDEVVMVAVSQKINMLKIQEEIAEWLKLKFDEKHMWTRAAKLRARLMDRNRKIIILDDVWEWLRFEDLGIPIESNFERCKVVLTSRSRYICKGIKNNKVFELKILEEEEAWIIFKETAGVCIENSYLRYLTKLVAAECKGLPLGLVTVAKALQDETEIYIWKRALSQLRQSDPIDFREVLIHVYMPLKLSYDYLDNDKVRNLFLMCCLFPEDYDIPIERLTWYRMGLQSFDHIPSIEEARNQTHRLVDKLKSCFLLMDGTDKLHVKMHDLMRDVAIYIGSKEKNGFLKSLHRTLKENSSDVNCNWMSVDISNEQMEVPVLSRFPKLRLLRLSSNEFYDISHISFEGIEDLNVLSFRRVSIGSLPPKLGSLTNLQTLRLFDCEVENISVIGDLTSLKILSCNGCKNIMELPAEIGRLKGLRLLELNGCRKLQRIPFRVISNLRWLEELKMRESFRRWEAEKNGKEKRNASLRELECLPNLSCLEIEIDDCTLSAQEIRLSQNLVKYYIRIGSNDYYFEEGEKVMNLQLSGAVGNWIQLLARNAESLSLKGDGSDNINLAETENLRNLNFGECSTVKKLGEARRCLLQLEVLEIQNCDAMEQVFWNEGTDDNTDGCIEFPKLKELTLKNLPNLTAFWQGLENIIIKFPNLTEMWIGELPKLNSLSHLNSETVVWHDQNTCSHLFCDPKVEMGPVRFLTIHNLGDNIKNVWCHQIPTNFFNNLERLEIFDMNGIRSLMSTSIAKNLVSLECLIISSCEEMVEVIERDDDYKQIADINCLFPNLRRLYMRSLHKLIRFWLWNHAVELPLLEQVGISNCPVIETFTLGPINTPNIREILVNSEKIDDEKDLNDVIRLIWIESQNKDEFEDDKYDWERGRDWGRGRKRRGGQG